MSYRASTDAVRLDEIARWRGRAERAEAQVQRLRGALVRVIDSGHHYAAQQIARATLAETEGR